MSCVAIQRVVVEVHLRVEREQVAGLGDDERVDLENRRVGRDEGVVERQHHLDALLERIAAQAEREAELLRLERLQADAWIDEDLVDLLGMLFGDLLDLDAALFADHEDDALRGAIEDEPEIQLAIDGETFFDEEPKDLLAAGAGLIRDERLAEQLARDRLGFGARLGKLDAAGLAAAAGVNLRLDDGNGAAEPLGDVVSFFGSKCHFPAGHRHAVFRKDSFSLVFVNLHKRISLLQSVLTSVVGTASMDLQKAFSSSVGSKFLIAFTGLSLLVFLVAHLAGNLFFIAGPAAFNEYSHKLVSNPLVYVAELGLLAVFALHIFKTVGMLAGSYSARPQRYAKKKWAKSKNDRSRKSVVVVDDDSHRHDHAAVRGDASCDVQVRHLLRNT